MYSGLTILNSLNLIIVNKLAHVGQIQFLIKICTNQKINLIFNYTRISLKLTENKLKLKFINSITSLTRCLCGRYFFAVRQAIVLNHCIFFENIF